MLSPQSIETYRQMTPAQRMRMTREMIEENWPALFRGSPELVDRRFELLRRENDERNRRMLTAIARTRISP